jgi:transcriptional regulator with XRE-family HTH domain
MSQIGTLAEAVAELGEPTYVLAAEVRIGPSDLGRIIQGRQSPTSEQAERIAERLGRTPESLFGSRRDEQ